MKKILFMACLAMLALSACSEKDGDWDPIKLTKNPLEVPAKGGTVQTSVKNYKGLWLLGVSRDGKALPTQLDPDAVVGDMYHLNSEYLTAHSDGQTVTVNVAPSEDGLAHKFVINVEYGDAFGSITVYQLSAPGR